MTKSTTSASAKVAFDDLFATTPIFIDVAHHEIHEGDTFSATLTDEDAANSDVIHGYMLTPATASPQKRIHIVLSRNGTGEHSFRIIEGVTYSSGGADVTPINRNRGSSNTTALQAVKVGSDKAANNISWSGGTTIWEERTGSGRGLGGDIRGTEEWVLAPSTAYIFEVESHAAGITLGLAATWYEHTDG